MTRTLPLTPTDEGIGPRAENKYYVKKRKLVPRVRLPSSPDFTRILQDLRGEGMSLEGLARELEISREGLYALLEGKGREPRYSPGRRLLLVWQTTFGKKLYPVLEEKK